VEVLAAAMNDAFGRSAGRMGNAGSGPADLLVTLHAPVLFFGTGLPEDRWHEGDARQLLAPARRLLNALLDGH
jgi:hypothetical protein